MIRVVWTSLTLSMTDFDGIISKNDREAANLHSTHYQKISNLDFSEARWLDKRKASNMVHRSLIKTNLAIPIFSEDFGMHELDEVLHDTDLRKSAGLDMIHVCMIDHLSRDARRMP
ncbi:hypothetical protein NPIL_569321 [Nephila pilipes]|uniref:Uncharacterized protein n=1 Tax=Nephila pilipes TaxID=299642 RepID=A0A8X6NVN7_NEPPI|nr:hypothetical protein NPIL_569321 [Nephila pilipes]